MGFVIHRHETAMVLHVFPTCPTLCNLRDCSTPGSPVLHYLPAFAQIHAYWPGDANHLILCCPLLFPLSAVPSISVFSRVSSSHQVANVGISASASVLPMNIQDWFPLGWTGWIFLRSKGLSRVFSNTTVQKHQFFSAQLSLWSNSHICTWLLEKP